MKSDWRGVEIMETSVGCGRRDHKSVTESVTYRNPVTGGAGNWGPRRGWIDSKFGGTPGEQTCSTRWTEFSTRGESVRLTGSRRTVQAQS